MKKDKLVPGLFSFKNEKEKEETLKKQEEALASIGWFRNPSSSDIFPEYNRKDN